MGKRMLYSGLELRSLLLGELAGEVAPAQGVVFRVILIESDSFPVRPFPGAVTATAAAFW